MDPRMMQQMMAQQEQKIPILFTSPDGPVIDARKSGRFMSPDRLKQYYSANEVAINDHTFPSIGEDPLKKYIGTNLRPDDFDYHKFMSALTKVHKHDPNFNPVMRILATQWNTQDKALALQTIIQHGAVIQSTILTNEQNESPVMRAISMLSIVPKENDGIILKILLDGGGSPNGLDINGKDYAQLLMERKRMDLLPMLVQAGYKPRTRAQSEKLWASAFKTFREQALINPEKALQDFYVFGATAKMGGWDGKEILGSSLSFDDRDPMSIRLRNVFKKIDQIEPNNERPRRPVRLYTNPGKGMMLDAEGAEPMWSSSLATLFTNSAIKRWSESIDREVNIAKTQAMLKILMDSPADINNNFFTRKFTIERHKYDLDSPVIDKKRNPHGDPLVIYALKNGQNDLFEKLISLDVNLNVRNPMGESILHVIAANAESKEDLLRKVQQIIGVSAPTKEDPDARKALYEHGHIGDWWITNKDGMTFLDIVQERHPEWIADITKELGIEPTLKQHIPPLNPAPLSLDFDPDTVGKIKLLHSSATESERHAHYRESAIALVRIQENLNNPDMQEYHDVLKERMASSIDAMSLEAKALATLDYMAHIEDSNPAVEQALNRILSDLTQRMKTDPVARDQIFDIFHNMALNKEDALVNGSITPGKDLGNIPIAFSAFAKVHGDDNLSHIAKKLNEQLMQQAEVKFGSEQSHDNDNKPK